MTSISGNVKKLSFVKSMASFFLLFCIVFIPFTFSLIRFQFALTQFLFGNIIGKIASVVFDHPMKDTGVYSDSVSMYILVAVLFLLALLFAFILGSVKNWQVKKAKFFSIVRFICLVYLSVVLSKYGFDKIFKTQFYLPEPNILFTPMGQLSQDILFWSTMGTSRVYNIFLGGVEMIAAILILFERTRLAGLVIAAASLLHIVAINFSFDISVKLFSIILLLVCLYLLQPYFSGLYHFFFSKTGGWGIDNKFNEADFSKPKRVWFTVLVAFVIIECFYPYLKSMNFNDDEAKRPYLHGAYKVEAVLSETDTLPADFLPVKRFFVHRDNYLIIQDQDDVMHDYKLQTGIVDSTFTITDYKLKVAKLRFRVVEKDSLVQLQYHSQGEEYWLIGKKIDWRKLPALQSNLNWTMDAN